jgi:acyl-CoA dehydrogenase
MAKAYATEIGWKVASKAMQIHGAYGLSTEYPVERYFRDARCYTFPDGTTQIQHLIIGREVLGMSAIR